MMRGTDISAYQSSIPPGDFCVLKATEGLGYNDPPFAARWKTLGQRGTLRGAYHFGHPKNDPTAEAEHFLRVVRAAGLAPGDMLVLDHEVSDGTSPAHCAAWARTWCQHVTDAVGRRPVVYTFLSFAWEGRCEGLGGYPLWIADPSRGPAHPRVPAPWKSWVMHQYAETGGIDRDVFNGDRAAWLALGGSKEDDMPSPKDLWEWDGIPSPPWKASAGNKSWTAATYLHWGYRHQAEIKAMVADLQAQGAARDAAIAELTKAVAALAADRGQQVDADAIVAKIRAAIDAIEIHVDVPDAAPEATP